jgi:hypothetical protein
MRQQRIAAEIAAAGGFKAWNLRRTAEERDSAEHHEIDAFLGLTKHRHRSSWPTYFQHQVAGSGEKGTGQLATLLRFARREAYGDARYVVIVFCATCGVLLELRGVRRAHAWYARHGRHVTWNRAIPVRQRPPRQRLTRSGEVREM